MNVLQNNYTVQKSRNVKSSQNKPNSNVQNKIDSSDTLSLGVGDRSKNLNSLNNLMQRFTPPLNMQNSMIIFTLPFH